ncbi:unnamed protein product [Pleuronectes platessa]|uniref:Uncharacterized protein n=1 Tax=Pleuronectes platessa TaxID=8262 RepID=A0A9N7YQE7_PLEPL|nr:unnamed protein product [Pleuronectes platessa]
MCQASLLCVPHSLPSPEALPLQESRARGFIVLHACPKTMPFHCFPLFHLCTPTQTALKFKHQVHSCPRNRGKSPLRPVLCGGAFLEGDTLLFPLAMLLSGLAGSGATRRVLA